MPRRLAAASNFRRLRRTPARRAAISVSAVCRWKKLDPPASNASVRSSGTDDRARDSRVRRSKTNAANPTAQRTAEIGAAARLRRRAWARRKSRERRGRSPEQPRRRERREGRSVARLRSARSILSVAARHALRRPEACKSNLTRSLAEEAWLTAEARERRCSRSRPRSSARQRAASERRALSAFAERSPSAPACWRRLRRAVQFGRRRSEPCSSLRLSCARSGSRRRASPRQDPRETAARSGSAFIDALMIGQVSHRRETFGRGDAEATMIEVSRLGKIRKLLIPRARVPRSRRASSASK